MAVRLDIRPRLRLPPEPPAARRKRFRLPPLALPTAGYWVLMAALTYFFAHLGPHPLDAAWASPAQPASQPAPGVAPVEQPTPAPEPTPLATAPAVDEPLDTALLAVAAPPPEPDQPAAAREPLATPSRSLASPPALPALPTPSPPAPVAAAPSPPLSFPEFTDSSRPARRERAADGPRIDSPFERADERPGASHSETPPPDAAPPAEQAPPTAVSSCEAAIARNNEQIELGAPRGPADITREAYAGILQNGRYLAGCRLPERTVFEICAAIKDGHAVGITVVSSPASSELNSCVKRAVGRLRFPNSAKLDVTHTRFDAVGR